MSKAVHMVIALLKVGIKVLLLLFIKQAKPFLFAFLHYIWSLHKLLLTLKGAMEFISVSEKAHLYFQFPSK